MVRSWPKVEAMPSPTSSGMARDPIPPSRRRGIALRPADGHRLPRSALIQNYGRHCPPGATETPQDRCRPHEVGEDIAPFAEFLTGIVRKGLAGEPLPPVPQA